MHHYTFPLSTYSTSTDLALEARELAGALNVKPDMEGVETSVSQEESMTVTRIRIVNEQGAKLLGKAIGYYVTIEAPELRKLNQDVEQKVTDCFVREFQDFLSQLSVQADAKILVVGLGNWHVTPDALGPMVVDQIWITRHLFELMPEQVQPGYRSVGAIIPGVLGTTGIESSEIVEGITKRVKPDLIIAIDALASKSLNRINTTIQIADTGIHPGSGIGNKRKGLTEQILGVPVIAIGVPTVVYASTIVNHTLQLMQQHLQAQSSQQVKMLGMLEHINQEERLQLVREILEPIGQDLLVTPKEVDQFSEDIANILANGLNTVLHQAVDAHNVATYTH